jgi:hypothetical protein
LRFLGAFLAALAALALVYLGLIRLVDPRGEFGTGLFPVVELDARGEKMRLFAAYCAAGAPEGLVLGSSRAMKLSPRVLEAATGRRFFNFAVDNARAEDDLAIYRWVRQQRVDVKLLVVGLDVEALHPEDKPDPGLVRNDELLQALARGGLPAPGLPAPPAGLLRRVKDCKSTFTVEYLSQAVRSVRLALRPAERRVPQMEFEGDGYLRYRLWERERAAGAFRFDQDLERCLAKYLARFEDMHQLSERRQASLRQLIREAQADGAQVLLFMTTLHPLTARYLEAHTSYAAVRAAAAAYQQGIAGDGVAAYDFSRPESYQGTPSGWYDCAHIDEANADRVAVALARGVR